MSSVFILFAKNFSPRVNLAHIADFVNVDASTIQHRASARKMPFRVDKEGSCDSAEIIDVAAYTDRIRKVASDAQAHEAMGQEVTLCDSGVTTGYRDKPGMDFSRHWQPKKFLTSEQDVNLRLARSGVNGVARWKTQRLDDHSGTGTLPMESFIGRWTYPLVRARDTCGGR